MERLTDKEVAYLERVGAMAGERQSPAPEDGGVKEAADRAEPRMYKPADGLLEMANRTVMDARNGNVLLKD